MKPTSIHEQLLRGYMRESSILDQKKFWDIIKYLVDLDKEKNIEDICSDLEITKQQLNSFIHFLREVDCQLEVSAEEDNLSVFPAPHIPKINIEFTLLEWLQFQAHFPALSTMRNKPYHDDIREKFLKVEKKYKKNDLYVPLQTISKLYEDTRRLKLVGEPDKEHLNQIAAVIEEAILREQVVSIQIQDKSVQVYPRKIIYFDGDFNLFGESVSDSSLINISISHIEAVEKTDYEWQMKFSPMELDDFISSLRSMSETSIRLVLKIYSYESFNLNLDYQHFENPCVFSNVDGEYIWAATIEQNDKIFEWLYKLGSDVEILDPKEFKREFLRYCENRLKKLA